METNDTLFESDTGTLPLEARYALHRLIKSPPIIESKHEELWKEIVNNQPRVEEILSELGCRLVINRQFQEMYLESADYEEIGFKPLRTITLNFLDSVLWIYLRSVLLKSMSSGNEIAAVDESEIFQHLANFVNGNMKDEVKRKRQINSAIKKALDNGVLRTPNADVGEKQYIISSLLQRLIKAEQVESLNESYKSYLEQLEGTRDNN